MMINKAVVTGPTGAVGVALVNELLNNDIEVYAIVRKGSNRVSNLNSKKNLHIVECDLCEYKNKLFRLIDAQIDIFYHLAWDGTYGDKRNDYNLQVANIEYAIDAVNVAKQLNCKAFIGVGSQSEYGNTNETKTPSTYCNPNNFYGACKLSASYITKVLCNQYNIRFNWCRIFSLFGPKDGNYTLIMSTINKLLNNEKCLFTKGDQIWDYIYSKDAAKAFRLIGEKGINNSIYLIASGKSATLRSYIETMHSIVNKDCKIEFGAIPYFQNQAMNLSADISNLKKDTGFECSYSFKDGILDLLNEIRSS